MFHNNIVIRLNCLIVCCLKTSTSVRVSHVRMAEHVRMKLMATTVPVFLDILGIHAKPVTR